VFCRHKRLDLIQQVLDTLDIADDERILAVRNALKQAWPEEWRSELERMLRETPDKSIAVMPAVAGFKRIPSEGALMFVLPICPDCVLYPQVRSMGRLKTRSAQASLVRHLKHSDPAVRGAAALSLARMGVNLTDTIPMDMVELEFWQLMFIALAGGPGLVPRLIDLAAASSNAGDIDFVLGVLGDTKSVEYLIGNLYRQNGVENTAIGLNLITGADLYEEVFIAEEIDEAELFEEEIERMKKGESLHPPGEEPGTTIVQLTRDPRKWEIWWHQNKSDFKPGIRYRNAKPYSPACLLENLRHEKSPVLVRQVAYEELVVRYGLDVPFETDMTVKNQLAGLAQMEALIQATTQQFQEGKWYFAGKPVE
jgi:hypothetical protein